VNSGTPWSAGRLDLVAGPHRLLFGQMYEDAEIEREAFMGRPRVFCIASAGNTAQRLADEHDVTACDINPAQLAYAERRLRGAAAEKGDAERAMNLARALAPLAGWREEIVRRFLRLTSCAEQLAYWRGHLDTRRFRAGFDALMSRAMLRAVYAPRFLSILPDKFGAVLRRRMERGFSRHANAFNPFAPALLLGESPEAPRPKHPRVQFVLGDAAQYLESCAPQSFDAFALSNILDGVDSSYRSRLARAVRRAAADDAVVVSRSFGEPATDMDPASNFAERDRSILWGVVDVRPAQSF
jgi:S-adenosylmethionine:diacylglycerol 3-amino-3-carboxypropyl transferase